MRISQRIITQHCVLLVLTYVLLLQHSTNKIPQHCECCSVNSGLKTLGFCLLSLDLTPL